jgi:hypothetical protein
MITFKNGKFSSKIFHLINSSRSGQPIVITKTGNMNITKQRFTPSARSTLSQMWPYHPHPLFYPLDEQSFFFGNFFYKINQGEISAQLRLPNNFYPDPTNHCGHMLFRNVFYTLSLDDFMLKSMIDIDDLADEWFIQSLGPNNLILNKQKDIIIIDKKNYTIVSKIDITKLGIDRIWTDKNFIAYLSCGKIHFDTIEQ